MKKYFLFITIILTLAFSLTNVTKNIMVKADDNTIPEGNDFATKVLRDPWDMSEFSDISTYLNSSGQDIALENISVQNGIFSATATRSSGAQFTSLFPGYNTAMLVGKVGELYPIESSTYKCLYIASKIESGSQTNPTTHDAVGVLWFADEKLNGGTWGGVQNIDMNPTTTWKLRKINLTENAYGTKWTDQTQWKGLRIDPTIYKTSFAVDWVRLTDCNPVYYDLSGLNGNTSYHLYLINNGREILINSFSTSANQTTYSVDFDGVAAGTYTYRVKDGTTTTIEGNVTVNQTPIINFTRPSTTSGDDYATKAGNPWDFESLNDVTKFNDITYSFENGLLNMTTTESYRDAFLELNSPTTIPSAVDYRYLTFRMLTDGPWQNVPEGMIARWVWKVPGSDGKDCWLVSHDIPFDVAWYNLSVDLHHPFNSTAEEHSAYCNGVPLNWKENTNVQQFRFDPNESIFNYPLFQQLDWLMLTKVDRVIKGNKFPLIFNLNKNLDQIDMDFYYTTDRNFPFQNNANISSIQAPFIQTKINNFFQLYLPFIINEKHITPDTDFIWDTYDVPLGEYYICAKIDDGFNIGVGCSEAPVKVTSE
jgi:hypothetical protein